MLNYTDLAKVVSCVSAVHKPICNFAAMALQQAFLAEPPTLTLDTNDFLAPAKADGADDDATAWCVPAPIPFA